MGHEIFHLVVLLALFCLRVKNVCVCKRASLVNWNLNLPVLNRKALTFYTEKLRSGQIISGLSLTISLVKITEFLAIMHRFFPLIEQPLIQYYTNLSTISILKIGCNVSLGHKASQIESSVIIQILLSKLDGDYRLIWILTTNSDSNKLTMLIFDYNRAIFY